MLKHVNKVISQISNTSCAKKIRNIIIWDEMMANSGHGAFKKFDWRQLNCQYENVHLFVGFNPLDVNYFQLHEAKTYKLTEGNNIVPYQSMEKTFVVQLKTPHRSSASIKKFLNFIRFHDQDKKYSRK